MGRLLKFMISAYLPRLAATRQSTCGTEGLSRMIRHFCDLCYRPINGLPAHLSLTRNGAPSSNLMLNVYSKEICKDCYRAIEDTVKSIRKEEK